MKKEKVLAVTLQDKPKYIDRVIEEKDFNIVVVNKEGERVTLASDKRKYPYELLCSLPVTVLTDRGEYCFIVPPGYVWNGADIPNMLWVFVGSKDEPEFKIPSMIHDFLLEYKQGFAKEFGLSMKEYRRLTSLIFRQLLKEYGTRTIKSNIMSWAVQVYQSTVNRKEWKEP